MVLKTDPRTDPRLAAALAAFDMDVAPPPPPVGPDSPLQDRLDFLAEVEMALDGFHDAIFSDLPPVENVERSTHTIKGVDGNDVHLYIHQPKQATGLLPCVYHIHGGGMVVLEATGSNCERWRNELAALGLVVIGVEFRNGAGKLGNHPFPSGLHDCQSGLEWTFQNKAELGISKIIVHGESGGANLGLALSLKSKQEGKLEQIDGVYAMCPYVSGAYKNRNPSLTSLFENEEYFFSTSMLAILASVYDPEGSNQDNPFCWPLKAELETLQGLPPHVVSVNELDPLRDEGMEYYRKLLSAGVSAYSRMVMGTCHCADQDFRKAMPEVFAATIRDIQGFAYSL
ncbi:MAG: alpha/beta hydrolase [Verrucomicrobiae bacterium]|nr:alpha/beta hydrolase [Verrucomicrobiae bacterium]